MTDIKYYDSNVVWAATSNNPIYSLEVPDPVPNDNPQPGQPRGCAGVFRSTDGGGSWAQKRINVATPDALENCVYALATIPTAVTGCSTPANCAYAATRNGLYFTSDGGTNWQPRTPPDLPVGNRKISDVFYASGNIVYVGSSNGITQDGVFKSMDGGTSWSPLISFLSGSNVNALGGRPGDTNTLYVAYGNGQLWRTTNGGPNAARWAAWNQTTQQGAHAGYPMVTVAIPQVNNSNDNIVYTGTMCQGGVYKTTDGGGTWTPQVVPNYYHGHFHYVMRVVAHPGVADAVYVTDTNVVSLTTNGGGTWAFPFLPNSCPPGYCGFHLHGLATAPSTTATLASTVLYVGTGHSDQSWGSQNANNRVWRATNGGQLSNNYYEITCPTPQAPGQFCTIPSPAPPGYFPQPAAGTCTPPANIAGCSSLISMAVDPANANTVWVGTFGSEQTPGLKDALGNNVGRGMGVVRGVGANVGMTGENWNWQKINNGLCADGVSGPCTGPPLDGSLSLFVGTIAIDPVFRYAYIATLNGIYERPLDDTTDPNCKGAPGPNCPWIDLSPDIYDFAGLCTAAGLNRADCRRFEALAIDPYAPNLTIYVGTSAQPGSPPPPAPPPLARIYRAVWGVPNPGWNWTLMTTTPSWLGPITWDRQFRVRDMQVGCTKAYAMVEGGAMFVMSTGRMPPCSPRTSSLTSIRR